MQPALVQTLTLVGGLAWAGCVLCLLGLHFLPTGVHPARGFVSDYALGRFGVLYQVQAVASGVCAACLLAAVVGLGVPAPRWGLGCLTLYAVSRVLIAAFPTDPPGRRTRIGMIHFVLATATFAGIAGAAVLLTPHLVRYDPWVDFVGPLYAAMQLTVASAVVLALVFKLPRAQPILGLIERGVYLGTLLWLGTLLLSLAAWAWSVMSIIDDRGMGNVSGHLRRVRSCAADRGVERG